MLSVKGIHVYYDAIHALKGISFTIEKGELVTLLGANGAGKTTTLKTLSGLLKPRQGAIELEGSSLENIGPHEIVRRGLRALLATRGAPPGAAAVVASCTVLPGGSGLQVGTSQGRRN